MLATQNAVYVSRISELLKLKGIARGAEITNKEFAAAVGITRPTASVWRSPDGVRSLPKSECQAALNAYFDVEWFQMWRLVVTNGTAAK